MTGDQSIYNQHMDMSHVDTVLSFFTFYFKFYFK